MGENYYGLPDDSKLMRKPASYTGLEEWVVIDPGTTLADGSQGRYKAGDIIRLDEENQFAAPDAKDFGDRLTEFSLGEIIPYAHMVSDIADAWKYNRLAEGMRDGSNTPEQNRELITHLANQQRDSTFGYKAADIAISGVPYMLEFAIENYAMAAIGGSATIGGLKTALMKGSGEAIEAGLKRIAAHELAVKSGELVGRKAIRAAEKKLLAELGETIAKKPALSFFKNLGARNLTASQMKAEAAKAGVPFVLGEETASFLARAPKGKASSLANRGVAQLTNGSVGGKVAAFFAGSRLDEFAEAAYGFNKARSTANELAAKAIGGNADDIARATASKALRDAALEGVKRLAPGAVGEVVGKMGVAKTLMRPDQVALGIIQNMTPQFALTEDEQGVVGAVLMDDGDDFLPAFAKAFGDVAIENMSEQSAESFILLKGMFGEAGKRALKASFLKSYIEKGVAGAARRGIPKNKALSMLKTHLFGGQGNPGALQKMGWAGVLDEMGEEAIGGALRMATGISKPGLPNIEDVAAMAVGFMFNPIAMGTYAKQAGADQYVKMYTKTREALEEAQDFSADFSAGGIQTQERTAKLEGILAEMAAYKQADSIHADKSMSKMKKLFRMAWLDRVWQSQAEYIGKTAGIEQAVLDADGKPREDAAGNAIMRRVEFDMEQIIDNQGKITPDNVRQMTQELLHTMIMSEEDLRKYHENIGSSTEELQKALKIHKSNRGITLRTTLSTAPYFAAKIGENMTADDMAYLKQNYPHMIQLSDNFNNNETPIIMNVNSDTSLSGLREQAKDDRKLGSVAQLIGVPHLNVTANHGQATIVVHSQNEMKRLVNNKLDMLEGAFLHLPKGRSLAQVPFRVIMDEWAAMSGQPISDALKDSGNVGVVKVEASYDPNMKRVTYSEVTSDSALAEDLLEAFMHDEDGQVYDWVIAEGQEIKKAFPNNTAIQNASELELVSKATAVHLGYAPNAVEGSFKNIVIDLDIQLSKDFLEALEKADAESDTNGDTKGGIVTFLQYAHTAAGGSHGIGKSTKEKAKELGAAIKAKEDAKKQEELDKVPEVKPAPDQKEAKKKKSAEKKAIKKKAKKKAEAKKKAQEPAPAEQQPEPTEPTEQPEGQPGDLQTKKPLKSVEDIQSQEPVVQEEQDEDQPIVDVEALKKALPKSVEALEAIANGAKGKMATFMKRLNAVMAEAQAPTKKTTDVDVKPEDQGGLTHSMSDLAAQTNGGQPEGSGIHFSDKERDDLLRERFKEFRALADTILGPTYPDAGQRLLWSYANGHEDLITDIDMHTREYIYSMLDELADESRPYIQQLKAYYRSITPVNYQTITLDENGKITLKQSNPSYRKVLANEDVIGEQLEDGRVYNGNSWHFLDVNGNGRPGYLGSSHMLETVKSMKMPASAYGQAGNAAMLDVPYQLLDGVIQNVPEEITGSTATDAKTLQRKHDLLGELQRKLWEQSEKRQDQGDGYWHIATKVGGKEQMYMLYLPRHSATNRANALARYTQMYKNLKQGIAEKFFASPSDVANMAGFEFDQAINHALVINKLVGDVAAFKDVDDFAKRMNQTGTPGMRMQSTDTLKEVRYIVFDDQDFMDGMAFYSRFGKEIGDQMGMTRTEVQKIFMNFRANGGTGSLHNYKPMASNVKQLDEYTRYKGLADWMDANNIDLAIPLSSVKLGNNENVKDRVKITDLYDIETRDFEGKKTAIKMNPKLDSFDESKVMTMRPEDIIVGSDYNYDMQPEYKKFLKQLQSVMVHYNGENYDAYRLRMSRLMRSRSEKAADLTLYDIIPYNHSLEEGEVPEDYDDVNKYAGLQPLMRKGLSNEELLSSVYGELAYTHLTAEANRRMMEPVSRVMRTAVAPGEIDSLTDGFNVRRTLDVVDGFISPSSLHANIEGRVYTEDLAKQYSFRSKDEAIKYLRQNTAEMMKEVPWMFRIDPKSNRQDKFDPIRPVINTHLIREWFSSETESAFTFSGELVLVSRVPISGISFTTLSSLDKRIGDGTASIAMSDAITQEVKGEDNDADQMFIDLIPHDQTRTSDAFEAHMFMLQAMQEYTPERLKYMKAQINMESLDEYIGEKEEGDHHLNTAEGQEYIRKLTDDWSAPLGVAAATAPTLRFMNELKMAYRSPTGVPLQPIIIDTGAQKPLMIHRTQKDVDALTEESKLAHDQVWGNIMLNFIVDSPSTGNLNPMGYNKYSVALLYAMATGSIHLQEESDIIAFAGEASRWLRESKAAQEYIQRRTNGEYDNQIFSTKDRAESFTARHGADGRAIKELAEISSDVFHLTQHFSISHDWPGSPVGFVNGVQFSTLPRNKFDIAPLKQSKYHNNTRMKAKVMRNLWAKNPLIYQEFTQSFTPGYKMHEASAVKMFAARLMQAAKILNRNFNARPEVFWNRIRSNPMVKAGYAKVEHSPLRYRLRGETEIKQLDTLTLKMTKTPWKNEEDHKNFMETLNSLSRQESAELMVASALTSVQKQANHKNQRSHAEGFFRHQTLEMASNMSIAIERVDDILFNDYVEFAEEKKALVEEISGFIRAGIDEGRVNGEEDRIKTFNPLPNLEDAATRITVKRMIESAAAARQIVDTPRDDTAAGQERAPISTQSLALMSPQVMQQLPVYYSTGWKIMLNQNKRMYDTAAAQRTENKIITEKMMRLAGMTKKAGWTLRKIKTGEHYGKFVLVNLDKRKDGTAWGFEEIIGPEKLGIPFSHKGAVAKLKELNKALIEPTQEEIELGHKILQAVTARLDDPNAEYVVNGVKSTGEVEGVENKKNRYYIVHNLNKTRTIIGSKEGYANAEAAEKALLEMDYKGPEGAEEIFAAEIMHGYAVVTEKIDQLINQFGKEKFNEIMALAKDQIAKAEKQANEMWEFVLDEQLPEAKSQYKEILRKLKRIGDERYASVFDAVAMEGKMLPNDGNIAAVLNEWTQNTWDSIIKASAVVMGTTSLDVDGDAAWMPEYRMDESAQFNQMNDKQMALSLKYAVETVNKLRQEKGGMKPFVVDQGADVREEMNRMIHESNDLLLETYERVEAVNTKYVKNWWVKRRNKDTAKFLFGTGEKKMLQKIEAQQAHFYVAGMDVLKGINRFNNWSKFMMLQFSAFHPFSLAESMIAMHGLNFKTAAKLLFEKRATLHELAGTLKRSRIDEKLIPKWNKGGMQLTHLNPNLAKVNFGKGNVDVVSRDIEWMVGNKLLKYPLGVPLKWLKTNTDNLLWNRAFPAMKLYTAEHVLYELELNHQQRNVPFDAEKAIEGISQMMNDGLGSQNVEQYIWSNPRVRQFLQMLAFAPDWTLSAFNISGAPNLPGIKHIIQANQSDLQKEWQTMKYWPGMIGLVMFAIPQAIQAAIYTWSAALNGGDPDPDDTPFIALNEESMRGIAGFGGKIDITPIVRHFGWVPLVGYEGGETGKRRVYVEFGKQAREVADWFMHPIQTLKFKTSSTVQYAYERLTGLSVGGWEHDDNAIVGLLKKITPMSILGPLEGRPSSLIAPVRTGMTKGRATMIFAKSLKAYGDKRVADRIDSKPKYRTNFALLNESVLEDAERNGVDARSVVNSAKRLVISTYYADFFKALNDKDFDKMEEIAQSIKRIDGTADRTLASVRTKLRARGETVSDVQSRQIEDAFQ